MMKRMAFLFACLLFSLTASGQNRSADQGKAHPSEDWRFHLTRVGGVVLTSAYLDTVGNAFRVTCTNCTGGGAGGAVDQGTAGASAWLFKIDQTTTANDVDAIQAGTWNLNNITGTISLPTGAATDRTTAASPFAFRLTDGSAFYDARQIRTITETITVKGAGAVVAESVAVRCINAAGNAFESCAGAGGGGGGAAPVSDGTLAGEADVINSAPAGTEYGVITRNIPSGTQPISAAALPLPSGASTESTQSTRLAEATFTGRVGEVQATPTANTILGRTKSIEDKLDGIQTELNQKTEPANTQAVSAAALPLPTGAATDAVFTGRVGEVQASPTANTVLGRLKSIEDKIDTLQTELNAKTEPANSQTITGTVTGNQGTANTAANRWPIYLTDGTNTMPTGDAGARRLYVAMANGGAELGTAGTGTGLTVTCTNCGGAVAPLFHGRACTFRTPGRAGTAGQKVLSIHNATGSAVTANIHKIVVDTYQTVVKAVTVPPTNIRMWKVTVLPTNGTALTKNKIQGSSTSSASITVLGDASADGTGSGTTLTATLPAGTFLSQEYASRLITAAGFEMTDRIEFFTGDDTNVKLSALEGVVIFLDYTVATMNPTTDMWSACVEWEEN